MSPSLLLKSLVLHACLTESISQTISSKLEMPSSANSRRGPVDWRYHGVVLLAIILDGMTLGLVALSVSRKVILPTQSNMEWSLIESLPIAGSVVGTAIAAVNGMAISQLVTMHTRILVASKGLTFQRWGYLSSFGAEALFASKKQLLDKTFFAAHLTGPYAMTPLFGMAIILLLAKGILPSIRWPLHAI